MKRIVMGMMVAMMAGAGVAEPVVSGLTAKQRFPWNGWVDITCTVSGIPAGEELFFSVTAVEQRTHKTISTRYVRFDATNGVFILKQAVSDGAYHLCWDAEKDLGKNKVGDYTLRVTVTPLVRDRVQLWGNGPYWATTNVGADYSDETGDYFFWGDTNGCKRVNDSWVENGTGNVAVFNRSYYNAISIQKSTLVAKGVIDTNLNLTPEYDAATVTWGEAWRLPTIAEFDNLRACRWERAEENGMPGFRVFGRDEYCAASIFLPLGGRAVADSLEYLNEKGFYLKATGMSARQFVMAYNSYLYSIENENVNSSPDGTPRDTSELLGCCVRPVADSPGMSDVALAAEVNLAIDTCEGVRSVVPGQSVSIAYSPTWDGAPSVTVKQDGETVMIDGASSAGDSAWTPPADADVGAVWTLTHTTANSEMTAQFKAWQATLAVTGGETRSVWCHDEVTMSAPVYPGFTFVLWEATTTAGDWQGVPDAAEDLLQMVDEATGKLVTYVFRSGKWVNTKLTPPADAAAREALLMGFKVKAGQGVIYRRAAGAGAMVLPGVRK